MPPLPNSNRSPSPLSSRPRNSESDSTTRRSFNGNPFHKPSALTNPRSFNPPTPANSPSGFGRRRSEGKEERGDFEGCEHEKENDKSMKPVKLRSAASGSKNFMAPTISAAYKLTPSPRKEVLVERNEPVRTSISLSEGKATFFSSNDQKKVDAHMESIDNDSQEKAFLQRPPSVTKALKRVTFADSPLDSGDSTEFEAESVFFDSDCVVTDISVKNKSSRDLMSSPIIASLDADPSLPPYDPKTNYLSPRPQFLHYKPNPRIGVLLNKEKGIDNGGVKSLEDSFTSLDNTSDTDGMEELSNGDDSRKDSEDSSTAEIEPPKAKEEDLHGSESLVCGGSKVLGNSEKDVHAKEREKNGWVRKLSFTCLFVVLLISCYSISVTYFPGTDTRMLKALNIFQLHQPAAAVDLAKANFNVFTQKFNHLSIESVPYLSSHIGQGDKLSHLQFMNLTELQNDILVGDYYKIQQGSEKSQEELERDDLEEEKKDEAAELFEGEILGDSVSDSNSENAPEETENDLVLTAALPPASHVDTESQENANREYYVALAPEVHEVSSESSPENHESGVNLESDANVEPWLDDIINLMTPSDVIAESSPENSEGNVNLDSDDANVKPFQEDISQKNPSDAIHPPLVELPSDMEPSPLAYSRAKPSAYYAIGGTAIILAVVSIAFAAFIIRKRVDGSVPHLNVDRNQLLGKKTILATSATEQLQQEKLCSHNLPPEDCVGESCPSGLSSFQSHTNRLRSANEAQSRERRVRRYAKRESFPSSDFSFGGSPSYGSFTTYETTPIKNATGDDEVVTPVRRSSRLRSQVTS